MTKLSKRVKAIQSKVDRNKFYSLDDALNLVKECATAKFDESIDVAVQLGIDAKKSDQVVRGAVVLPAGTGKHVRVAVFAQGEKAEQAKANTLEVVNTLKTKYGAEAEKAYNEAATNLGMSVQELNALAARNPKAVFKILGVTPEAPQVNVSSSASPSFNTDGFQPKQDSFIGRNTKATLIGATTNDLNEETQRAKQMVEELHKQGKTISDLTNPKVYFKTFK